MKRFSLLFVMLLASVFAFSQTTILSEDFESSSSLPTGWSVVTQATDGGWLVGSNTQLQSSYFPIPAHTTMVATNDDACNCTKMNEFLVLPAQNLAAYTTVFFSADIFFIEGSYNAALEEGYIVVSTDGGTSWTTLKQLSGDANWRNVVVDASSVAGDTSVTFAFKYNDDNDWLYGYAVDNVEIFVPVDRDAAMAEVGVPAYVLPNSTVDVDGVINNMGGAAITAFDLHWTVNGGNVNTQNLTGLNIAPLASYNYTHSTTWTPTTLGTYTIKVWTSNINGMADQNLTNDTMEVTVEVENFIQRLPLHEVFTSSTCGPCVAGNANLGAIFNAHPDMFSVIKYQMNWPGNGDPYYTAEGGVRKTYYAVSGVPDMNVDGQNNIFPTSYTASQLEEAYQTPSYLDLTAHHTIDTDTIHVHVHLESLKDYAGNLKLHVAVVENKTTGNIASNGETEFHYVMMKMLPDANGTGMTSISSASGQGFHFTQDLSGTNVEEMSDLSVVVFVQNHSTKEVLQSAWSSESALSIEDFDGSGIVNLFPNPATQSAQLAYNLDGYSKVELRVVNTLGETVILRDFGMQSAGLQKLSFDVDGLANGLYMVNLIIDNKVYIRKLNVR